MKMRCLITAALALAMAIPAWPATGTHSPSTALQFFDNNGAVCNGCKLFTYSPGTTTKKTTYTDVDLSSANANPIVLDSAGRATIFLTPGESYKYVLAPSTDTDPPTSATWTRDNIGAVPPAGSATDNDITGTAGETLAAADLVYLSDGSGGNTAGRWYKADADNTYSSTLARQLGIATVAASSGAAVTVRIAGRATGLSGLVAGTTYYASATAGALTSTAPANARAVATADTTSTAIVGPWVGTIDGTSTLGGVLTIAAQTIAGVKTFSSAPVFGGAPTFKPGAAASAAATTSGRVASVIVSVGNVGGGADDLQSTPLLADTLNADGKAIRITCVGTGANNANAKNVTLRFGATSSTAVAMTTGAAIAWEFTAEVWRTSATTQRMRVHFFSSTASGTGVVQNVEYLTPAETLSSAITIKVVGTGVADNDIVQTVLMVETVG